MPINELESQIFFAESINLKGTPLIRFAALSTFPPEGKARGCARTRNIRDS